MRFLKFHTYCIFSVTLFNDCFLPSGKVIPVRKGGRWSNGCDNRPISILPSFSKVFEMILKLQISGHSHRKYLLCLFQSGLRSGCSIPTARRRRIVDDQRREMDRDKVLVIILLDFLKALDIMLLFTN